MTRIAIVAVLAVALAPRGGRGEGQPLARRRRHRRQGSLPIRAAEALGRRGAGGLRPRREADVPVDGRRTGPAEADEIALADGEAAVADGADRAVGVVGGHGARSSFSLHETATIGRTHRRLPNIPHFANSRP